MSDPTTITLPPFAEELFTLSECVCSEIKASGIGDVCWCGVWPGDEVSWEYCADCGNESCGMAWTRLIAAFPSEIFPTPTLDTVPCTKPLALQLEVGALRCMPHPGDGEIVAPAVMAEVVLRQYVDMWSLYKALTCCELKQRITVEAFVPLGPSGGCVGGLWTAYFPMD